MLSRFGNHNYSEVRIASPEPGFKSCGQVSIRNGAPNKQFLFMQRLQSLRILGPARQPKPDTAGVHGEQSQDD